MFRIRWVTTLGVLVLLLGNGRARGEAQFAIAGDFMGMLRDEIAWNLSILETPKFRKNLVDHELTVIVIPPSQADPDKPSILVCTRKQTDLVPQEITPAELKILNAFATETVYQLLMDVQVLVSSRPSEAPLTAEAKQKVIELQKRMAIMPEKRKASVTFLLGARLAELEPTQPELSKYVHAFRKEVEARAIASLKAPLKEDLGRPQVFGTVGLTKGALNSIKDVQEIEVDGHRYQKTWTGGSLILVPQAKDAPRPTDTDPPLKKLGLHADVHTVIKDAGPNKVIMKGSPIHK